uniref:Zona pellucida protein AX 4 n=1 Tax=Echeneis naucrates TaxID=173247 RepID=A0A665VCS2_ECHNA
CGHNIPSAWFMLLFFFFWFAGVMKQVCTPSLSRMQQSVATLSVFSLFRASWCSEPLTSAVTLTTKYARRCKCTMFIGFLWYSGSCVILSVSQDDELFTFNFKLIVTHEGKEVTYALNKTCSIALPWSLREITCEENYMEVSVRSEIPCPSGTEEEDWDVVKHAHGSTTSDWQVMFQRAEEQLMPMKLSEARKQGYIFDITHGRLVFRMPYGQPDSFSTEVNGVPVEVVHATLFSRQRWVVVMVDLVTACSMDEGSYDNGAIVWETPEVLHRLLSGLHDVRVQIGVDGELMEQPVAEKRGYTVENHNTTIQISIPYNAEGGYRKSSVMDGLYEFYSFNLYLEQILVDAGHVETRLRFHRTLASPLLPHHIFTANQTALEERLFTIYLGNVPEDVQLTAVDLNGHKCQVPFTNTSSHMITTVVHPNNTHGYTLKVPFDDPVVIQQYSKADAVLHHKLNINYTLVVIPENSTFHHLTTVVASFADVSPPVFAAVCSESGISFKLDHRPFDYLWYITIGSDLLTPELAAQHGYIMSNDSQSLLLDVPLYTNGYKYKDITLKGFLGTFEILVRDHETSEVQSSTVKTCPFTSTELIMCSTDGKVTVVADVSGGIPARTTLIDKSCRPKKVDETRALFSFSLNSCGSTVKLGKENVTYENKIFYSKRYLGVSKAASDSHTRVTVQCTYPIAGLFSLFSEYRFESDLVGYGNIIHNVSTAGTPIIPTTKPTTTLQTIPTTRELVPSPTAVHPPVRYIRVTRVYNRYGVKEGENVKLELLQVRSCLTFWHLFTGPAGTFQSKLNAAKL